MAEKDRIDIFFNGIETEYLKIDGIKQILYSHTPDGEYLIDFWLMVYESATREKDFAFFDDTVYTYSCRKLGLDPTNLKNAIVRLVELNKRGKK